jgi:hypothetical protein
MGAHHETRKIEIPLVGWYIRALHVTELALVTLIDDAVLLGGGQLMYRTVAFVNEIEQSRERGTKVETDTTAMADVIDALKLLAKIWLIKVFGMIGVIGRRHSRHPYQG